MNGKLKIKSMMKAVRVVAAWAMLLVLLWPGAKAHGQTDNYFYINESPRDGGSSGSWSGLGMSGDGGSSGTWDGFGFVGNGGTGTWNGLGLSGNGGSSGTWDGFGFAGDGGSSGTWNGFGFAGDGGSSGTWTGFEYGDPLPTGAGLLALTVSGLCYAGLKRRKIQNSKI